MNFTSRSETFFLGTPCKRTMSLKNRLAICDASSLLWQAIKCAILEKRSTTTKIESCPLLVLGNPNTKSMLISSHGDVGVGRGVYKPCGLSLDLALLQVMQRFTNLSTYRLMRGQKK